MLQADCSFINKGMQNVERVVFPLGSDKEAITLKATFNTINPFDLMAVEKVFLVPP